MSIDRIAREMVDVEPSAQLEARIRARLDAEPRARAARWWSWQVAVPACAALAAVVIAAMVIRGPERPEVVSGVARGANSPGSQVPNSETSQVASASLPRDSPSVAPRSAAARPSRWVSRVATKEPELSAEELAWMERRVPALDPVVALDVQHLRVASIQPEPLAITPLTMTPVGTDGAGNERRNDRQ